MFRLPDFDTSLSSYLRGVRNPDLTIRILFLLLAIPAGLLACSPSVAAQSCLSADELKTTLARISEPPPTSVNKKLENLLLKTAEEQQELLLKVVEEDQAKESLKKRLREAYQKNTGVLCQVIKEHGWPTTALVDKDGVIAAFKILKTSAPHELQRDLLPIVAATIKTDEIQKSEVAGLVDRLRVAAGMKQLFGTQAVKRNGFLVLYPIEDEANLEARRKQFELPTMPENIRFLEHYYHTPLIRARDVPDSTLSTQLKDSLTKAISSTDLDTTEVSENDVIPVDSSLVNLPVSVFSNKLQAYVGTLGKDDFKVFEDGHEQQISFFASTAVPFDLVLLLDLSGSTSDKRDLIRKSTQRFIESARSTDRIAVVTFSDTVQVVSPLTEDRARLLASITDMKGKGGSNIWDAVKFTMDNVVGPQSLERRRAVVLMTDGVDGALVPFAGAGGSKTSFADLVELIGKSDTLIVPIYLDTESDDFGWDKSIYENARKTLTLMAQESGGSFYRARKIADLNGVYEQVINDLGKVYSLGYSSLNNRRDGTWRNVEIRITNRPDLVAHSRPGYYAR